MNLDPNFLYGLLPEVYRLRDEQGGQTLQALTALLQSGLDEVLAHLEQLYGNGFIETCEEWAVPYLGDLVGVSLDEGRHILPEQRAWVANALKYPRSKGIAANLQPLIRDAIGWYSRVSERFQTLAVNQNFAVLRPGRGGTAPVSDRLAMKSQPGPFDDLPRLAAISVQPPIGGTQTPLDVAVYLWRLQAFPLHFSLPYPQPDPSLNGLFLFDPAGFDVALFNLPQKPLSAGESTPSLDCPACIEPATFARDLETPPTLLIENGQRHAQSRFYGPDRSLCIYLKQKVLLPQQIGAMDLGDWELPPAATRLLITPTLALNPFPLPGRIPPRPQTGGAFAAGCFLYGDPGRAAHGTSGCG